ncbi:hypothetical protein [Phormidium sp. CCY1219]|uniref:hypothetical protein n=1 Tax=Phormidium sp. CCY1219 TaxID=2886104 RepID=UPI002D1EDD93|nr:hypothetical protein [Phormidium sp. CCY1219]MEB3831049.1 hypothetical protein [Phormidium sp. CCY1219]
MEWFHPSGRSPLSVDAIDRVFFGKSCRGSPSTIATPTLAPKQENPETARSRLGIPFNCRDRLGIAGLCG